MSFDLFLYCFKAGDTAPADRAAVKRVIDEQGVVTPDQYGQYHVPLPNGEVITLAAQDLDSPEEFDGCAFHLHGFSVEYCHFILKLAKAGDMVIFNAQGKDEPSNPVLILSDHKQELEVPNNMYKHAVLARDGLHLYTLLDGSYEGWERYREQILRQSG
ncbi:hypothetical protein FACS189487_07030 [Campylobacterota bacterium]|nr:hypothetical protein FACS189487_07030 [Campylobacterota bacterium]